MTWRGGYAHTRDATRWRPSFVHLALSMNLACDGAKNRSAAGKTKGPGALTRLVLVFDWLATPCDIEGQICEIVRR